MSLPERLARCDREIALAVAESAKPHTREEQNVLHLWEMDWLWERDNVLAEMAAVRETRVA